MKLEGIIRKEFIIFFIDFSRQMIVLNFHKLAKHTKLQAPGLRKPLTNLLLHDHKYFQDRNESVLYLTPLSAQGRPDTSVLRIASIPIYSGEL